MNQYTDSYATPNSPQNDDHHQGQAWEAKPSPQPLFPDGFSLIGKDLQSPFQHHSDTGVVTSYVEEMLAQSLGEQPSPKT